MALRECNLPVGGILNPLDLYLPLAHILLLLLAKQICGLRPPSTNDKPLQTLYYTFMSFFFFLPCSLSLSPTTTTTHVLTHPTSSLPAYKPQNPTRWPPPLPPPPVVFDFL